MRKSLPAGYHEVFFHSFTLFTVSVFYGFFPSCWARCRFDLAKEGLYGNDFSDRFFQSHVTRVRFIRCVGISALSDLASILLSASKARAREGLGKKSPANKI
jgi:hypothetical protein